MSQAFSIELQLGKKYKFDKMTKSRKKGFCGSFFSEIESVPLKTYKTTKIWKKNKF